MGPREVFDKRLRQAVKSSTFIVQQEAQQNHDFTTRTAQLERAIDTKFSFEEGNNIGVVYIDNRVAPYGIFVHQGTRPHSIKPRTKRVLRWAPMAGNNFFFAKEVYHPGTKSDPFLYDALARKRNDVLDTFSKATGRAIEDICNSEWLGSTERVMRIDL